MILVIFCLTATLQNNSLCLFPNILINATPGIILFVKRDIILFARRNKNKKMNTQESKERKFEEESREKG